MTIEDAFKAILDERSLSPNERNILQSLVLHSDGGNWCVMSVRRLSDLTGLSYEGTRQITKTLIDRGYISTQKGSGGTDYKPFPFNVRRGLDDEAARHRFIVSVEDMIRLRQAVSKQITEFTSLIEVAGRRRDRAEEVKLLAQLDAYREIYRRIETYLKAHEVKV